MIVGLSTVIVGVKCKSTKEHKERTFFIANVIFNSLIYSRLHWLSEDKSCSRYFHHLVNFQLILLLMRRLDTYSIASICASYLYLLVVVSLRVDNSVRLSSASSVLKFSQSVASRTTISVDILNISEVD